MKLFFYFLAFWIPIAACIWCVFSYLMPVDEREVRKNIWMPENALIIDNHLPSAVGTYYLDLVVYRRLDATHHTVFFSTENDTMRVFYRSEDKEDPRIKFSASETIYTRGLHEVRDYRFDQNTGQLVLIIDDNLELLITLLIIAPIATLLISGIFALIVYGVSQAFK